MYVDRSVIRVSHLSAHEWGFEERRLLVEDPPRRANECLFQWSSNLNPLHRWSTALIPSGVECLLLAQEMWQNTPQLICTLLLLFFSENSAVISPAQHLYKDFTQSWGHLVGMTITSHTSLIGHFLFRIIKFKVFAAFLSPAASHFSLH